VEVGELELLFGGLHWRAERLIQATLENRGCKARPLPPATKADLLVGRERADVSSAGKSTGRAALQRASVTILNSIAAAHPAKIPAAFRFAIKLLR
jgi:hypothetical protein